MILSAASKKLALLPTRPPAFLEIMECSAVSKLPDGPQWIYEILCGPPHKISVALRLKADAEHDITVDGPELAAQAIRASLVDEFQMIVCPVVVGSGKRFFPDGVRLNLELVDAWCCCVVPRRSEGHVSFNGEFAALLPWIDRRMRGRHGWRVTFHPLHDDEPRTAYRRTITPLRKRRSLTRDSGVVLTDLIPDGR